MQAKTEAEVILEREGLEQEKIWVIHKSGFTLGTLIDDSPKRSSQYTSYSLVKSQVRTCMYASECGPRNLNIVCMTVCVCVCVRVCVCLFVYVCVHDLYE